MNNTIYLMIGLPGSGKTYHANKMGLVVIDDITSTDQLPDSPPFIITDVNFCDSIILNKAIDQLKRKYHNESISIELIYFENDAEKCRRNVVCRDDGRCVEGTIRRFEAVYQPPRDANKIWNIC